jgi:hypothetical protein
MKMFFVPKKKEGRKMFCAYVLKTEPAIEPAGCWFTSLLVEPLGHWSNRMKEPDHSISKNI